MSLKYIVNWSLSGFRKAEHKAGDILTAAEHEAEEIARLVKDGVLSIFEGKKAAPAQEATGTIPDRYVMTADQLVAEAKDKFNFDLDPTLSKDAMLAEIAALEAGKQSIDDGTADNSPDKPVEEMTKAQLVDYAKAKFDYELNPSLAKPAMVAEIADLQADEDAAKAPQA